MDNLPQFKLVIELINNIIVFDKNNKVVFAGEEIKNTLKDAGIHFEEMFLKKYAEESEESQMKKTLEKARSSQLPRTFISKKLEKVFLFFTVNHANSDYIIFSAKEEVLQFSKIERDLKARVKELECLYSISHTLESAKSLEGAIPNCIDQIKKGFQFPNHTKVIIDLNGKKYGDVDIAKEKQHSGLVIDIKLNERKRGKLHIFLIKKVKFLKEEKALIHEIAGKITRAIEKDEKKNTLEEQQNILLSKNETLVKLTEQLHQSSENFKTVFSAIADRIIVIDPDFNIIMSNKKEIGNSEKCYQKLFNAKKKCENCNAVVTFGKGKNSMMEKSANGKFYLMRSYPIQNKEGQVERVLEVCRDITLHKQLESQLIQSYKLASLGKLVAGVAHEINNPNTFILGNLKIIQEAFEDIFPILDTHFSDHHDEKIARLHYDVFKENISVLINDMIEGANRTNQIVLDLRNFARKDGESLSDMVDINHVIETHLIFTQKHIKKQANIEYDLNHDVPKFTGSIQRLEQVLMNIVINASQAVENGFGVITIKTDYDKPAKEVVIKISDNGKGMDETTQKNIFDPFFTTKRDKGGTGLGLSISYGIIKDHGGKIDVDSKLGTGTTFTIRIPAVINEEK